MTTQVLRTCVSAVAFATALTIATPLYAADGADGPDQFDLGGARAVSLKMALWSVVIALLVYGIVLYARGDFG